MCATKPHPDSLDYLAKQLENKGQKSIAAEAEEIINGERREAYGEVRESFTKIAGLWSSLLGFKITPEQVAQMLIIFKVARENNKHKRDNLTDIIGYTLLLEKLENSKLVK